MATKFLFLRYRDTHKSNQTAEPPSERDSGDSADPFHRWLFPGLEREKKLVDRKEFLDMVKTMFAALALLSVGSSGISLYLQRQVTQEEYDWRHRKEAQDIVRIWDERTSTRKSVVQSFFQNRYHKEEMIQISKADAKAIRHATNPQIPGSPAAETLTDVEKEQRQWWTLRVAIGELLNFFETVATACQRGIANEDILRESLGPPMADWYRYLEEYIRIADAETHRKVWRPYYDLMEKWIPAMTAEQQQQNPAPHTGKNPARDSRSLERRGSFGERKATLIS